MYLQLEDYPPYSDILSDIMRLTSIKTKDVFMYKNYSVNTN